MQHHFKQPGLHDGWFSRKERQPRLTPRARMSCRVGRFRIGCHEKAVTWKHPVTSGPGWGLLPAVSASIFIIHGSFKNDAYRTCGTRMSPA